MNRAFVSCLLILSVWGCESSSPNESEAGGAARGAAASTAAGRDERAHGLFTPGQLKWKPAPSSLPRGAEAAILEGDPSRSGFFAMRIRFPDGYKIPPHWHPNQERVTVLKGTFHLGQGESFSADSARALPVGTYSTMPPGMRHFAFADGETEIQLATIGPWAIRYVNPADDPRQAGPATGAAAR